MKGDESMVEWGNEGPRRLAQVQRVEVPGFGAQLEGVEAFVELFPGLAQPSAIWYCYRVTIWEKDMGRWRNMNLC